MREFNRRPVPEPLTHEEAEQQAFRLGIIKFLITHEGQMFVNSKYSRFFAKPDHTPRENWPYILLYWKYKKHWKGQGPLESASLSEITDFLTKHYMEYWKQEISAQQEASANGNARVFSALQPKTLTPKNSTKNSNNSRIEDRNFQDFNEIIRPPAPDPKRLEPLIIDYRRIMNYLSLASLDPLAHSI